ncbi:hypothetical protein HNR46_000112 [Haloferula luteola]|uniref:beta-galactosidase n=1 Tax=Haloferula luteola TaxID=595692 RepID=A0A840VAF5_9BACT|nr:hypothetical protein [Haloferula luteola]MBB5349891.1 hypothetical protein [Haloferula luteola]
MTQHLILALALASLASAKNFDWEEADVLRVHTEAPRATTMAFPDKDSAQTLLRLESTWCHMLNGSWKFHHVGNPANNPHGFEMPGFDDSTWDGIPGPSNWQLHGYGIPSPSIPTSPIAKIAANFRGVGDKGASCATIRSDAFDALWEAMRRGNPLAHPECVDAFDIHSCRMVEGMVNYPLLSE